MAAEPQDFPMEGVPGTPGIREVRPESSSENFRFCTPASGDPNPGIRRVSLRAEIDTSPPFGSVKEAVTRFGGSGPWLPLYKFGEAYQGIEEFDIKRVEEQAAELEKDLIVKELETLDVLEELGTTKRIVEELKRQLQNEALKCINTPDMNSSSSSSSSPLDDHEPAAIKEMNKEHDDHCEQQRQEMMMMMKNCPVSSPDLILMELKQAKLNLGKTINDLGVIQTSVESLNKKMKKEKILLEKNRERLTCNQFPGNVEANNSSNTVKQQQPFHNNIPISPKPDQLKKMVEVTSRNKQPCLKTAEMRLVAARKMEEAARAAEALALIEMNSLTGIKAMPSSINDHNSFSLPEPDHQPFPRTPKPQRPSSASAAAAAAAAEEVANKKVIHAMHKFAEANISKLAILRKLEEASEEVKHSKEALEEALNRVEIASRKQLDAEEALRRWIPNHNDHEHKKHVVYNVPKINNFNQNLVPRSPLHDLNNKNPTMDDEAKPVLRPTVSMRDILSRKQVSPEDCVVMKRPNNEGNNTHERQKVALSQMLHELREDFTFPSKPEQKDINGGDEQKQFFTQRRKFGFIHISLPLAKQSKKKSQALNNNGMQ